MAFSWEENCKDLGCLYLLLWLNGVSSNDGDHSYLEYP